VYQFLTPGTALQYEARAMSRDYRKSPDWGISPEREGAGASIIRHIEEYCRLHSIV